MTVTGVSRRPARTLLKTISFEIPAAEATEVIVTGDFTGWATDRIRLNKGSDGLWRVTFALAPGEYQYRLLVDGQWKNDPAGDRRVPNAFGSENDVLSVF